MQNFKKQIEKLNKTLTKWGCHYQVYDFDGYTIEELLMQFFYKINEVIEMVNEYSNLVSALIEWVIEEGLKDIVNEKLEEMVQDGTLSDIINEKIFGELNNRIDELELSFEDFKTLINSQLGEFEKDIQKKLDTMKDEIEEGYSQADENIREEFNSKFEELEEEVNTTISSKLSNDFERKIFDKYGLEKNGEISTALQKFVDAVNQGEDNGIIFIPKGEYTWSKEVTNVNNVHIIFSPHAHLKRSSSLLSGFIINGVHGVDYEGRVAGSNITIEGGVWDVNINEFTGQCAVFNFGLGENITVRNAKFINLRISHALDISGCKDVLIENCEFGDWVGDEGAYTEVIQLSTHTKAGFPQFGHNEKALNIPMENVIIRGNKFGKCAVAVGSHGSIYNVWDSDILIEKNHFKECTYACVRGYHWVRTRIIDNDFGRHANAIRMEGMHQIIDLARPYSQSCQDITIRGNRFGECTKDNYETIYIKGYRGATETTTETGYCNRVTITENSFNNTRKGTKSIWVTQGCKVVISNNVGDNYIFCRLGNCKTFNVTGNVVRSVGNVCIIASSDSVPYQDNFGCSYGTITGNDITFDNGSAIMVVKCWTINVHGNSITLHGRADDTKAVDYNTNCNRGYVSGNTVCSPGGLSHPVYDITASCSNILVGINISFGITGPDTNVEGSGVSGKFVPTFSK